MVPLLQLEQLDGEDGQVSHWSIEQNYAYLNSRCKMSRRIIFDLFFICDNINNNSSINMRFF